MDRNYQRIKKRMLAEIMDLDCVVLYSYYKKSEQNINQILKQSVYITLLSNIIAALEEFTTVIFDGFGLEDFENNIVHSTKIYPFVTDIRPGDSQQEPGLQVTKGGSLIAGFENKPKGTSSGSATVDIAKEKRIGFHLINAFRVMYGVGILQYEPYLDGGNNTWTGSFTLRGETYNFTNIRYGAQPWAETENASKKIAHEGEGLDKGPLAGAQFTISVRNTIVDYASNKYAYAWGENVSSGSKWGEFAANVKHFFPRCGKQNFL